MFYVLEYSAVLLFSLWQQYEEGEKNSKQLLEACSYLLNPF